MIELFAVLNGKILEDLGDEVSATYTRIHYLLNGLKEYPDIEVKCIGYKHRPGKNFTVILINNLIKTEVAIRTAWLLIRDRPIAYFAYPHSLTTIQNRVIFLLCRSLRLRIVLDIHDTIEQASVIGAGRATLNERHEGGYFKDGTLILALNHPMWNSLVRKYQISHDKQVIFLPNAYEEILCELYPHIYKSSKNRFNICYLGGLTKNRGIDILVDACKNLHEEFPYLRLHLFGSYGEGFSTELKDAIERSSYISRRLVPRKNLHRALIDIDLFVMPYDPRESYMNFSSPMKLFEYIGTAKPILCTKCESLLGIGREGGIVYTGYSLDEMVENIKILIDEPEKREEASRHLYKIRPSYTWRERAKTLHDALMSL